MLQHMTEISGSESTVNSLLITDLAGCTLIPYVDTWREEIEVSLPLA